MPKVSIIIPVYNVENYLRDCLDSVINQTLSDIEIICINDCSTDGSLEILKEYAQKDNRIILINLEENHGQGYCRNLAIDQASGDYVMFLDSDDWLDLKACEIAYNQILQNQNDFVMFNYKKYIPEKNIYKSGTNFVKIFGDKINESNLKISEQNSNFIKNCFSTCRIYNRDFLNKNNIRYSILRAFEDNIFVFNSVVSADNFSVIDKPLYFYRIHSESTCFNPKHWQYIIPARMESYRILKKKNASKNLMDFFAIYSIKSILKWYKHFCQINISKRKELFYEIKDFFVTLSKEVDISSLKDEINNEDIVSYKRYNQILNYSYKKYVFVMFLKKIFSVYKNSHDLYIYFCGIKTRIRRKNK